MQRAFVGTQDLPVSRAEKVVQFVEKSVAQLKRSLTQEELTNCTVCTETCQQCVQRFRTAMATVGVSYFYLLSFY